MNTNKVKPRSGRQRLVLAALLLLMMSGIAYAQDVFFICYRCQLVWPLPGAPGTGTDRSIHKLCENCSNPERRCNEALQALREQIAKVEQILRDDWHEYHQMSSSHGDPLYRAALGNAIAQWQAELDRLRDVLARLTVECAAESGNLGTPGATPPSGSNVPRDAPTTAPAPTGTSSQPATSTTDAAAPAAPPYTPKPLSQQLRIRQAQMGRLASVTPQSATSTSPGAVPQSATAEIAGHEGAFLVAHRYAAPLSRVDVPAEGMTTDVTEEGDPETSGTWTAGEEGLAQPKLLPVEGGPPMAGRYSLADLDAAFLRAQRNNANAVAYADALQHTEAQAQVALAQGDKTKAIALIDHALSLTTEGQVEARTAGREYNAVVSPLYEQAWWLDKHVHSLKLTVAQALAKWQAQVKTNGLPAKYVEALKEAGGSDEQIARHKEELLAVKPEEAQAAYAWLMMVGKHVKADDRPLEDAEWDIIAVRLLHLRPKEEAAATPGQ